jgi:hypothetical protein
MAYLGKNLLSWEKFRFFFVKKSDIQSHDRFFWEGFCSISKISAKTKKK